jgi:maltooligosyltrehalose trehalohydrolase
MSKAIERRLPVGAEPLPGGVHFRVWAPQRRSVGVVVAGTDTFELEPDRDGYFSGFADGALPGALYRFRLDRGDQLYPDPASRFQPDGPHGPSQVVDGFAFGWTDEEWVGVRIENQVIYELHVGTFTREGTWNTARQRLPELAETGMTIIEVMPVADFAGTFGWGYDGVNLFAPTRLYGTPDDFRAFVDHAHHNGLGVVLDVVYNHLGPDGNYLKEFSTSYFSDRYESEWGEALNFDGMNSEPVREFIISNARYWIEEFHLDGLRLDATQQIFDSSADHIITCITRETRHAAGTRSILIIAENERQEAKLARSQDDDGYGLDAIWNDDFHHTVHVAATGHNEAYYTDYLGTPQELISAIKWGFLYQGQFYTWQSQCRGSFALDLKPASFINYIQNHDQIANSAYGARLHEVTTPGRYKALTALMLLGPGTPMLFQGQEFGASSPFLYFADHNNTLASLVAQGRAQFLHQFPSIANPFVMGFPHDRSTFEKCKLDHSERETNSHILALHQDLLKLRREDPIFREQRSDWIHGAILRTDAFALRFFSETHGDRLIVMNMGRGFDWRPAPEPLLVASSGMHWELLWSSEDPRYRGSGGFSMRMIGILSIPAHSAVVMYERPSD